MEKIALVDCDGVLADFAQAVADCAEFVWGERRYVCQFSDWDFATAYSEVVSDYVFWDVIAQFINPRSLAEYPGASSLLSRLDRAGYRTVVLTAPMTAAACNWEKERREWLMIAMGIQSDDVIFCPHELKYLVNGDLLIEDSPDTCEKWVKAAPGRTARLVTRPWNADYEEDGVLIRRIVV